MLEQQQIKEIAAILRQAGQLILSAHESVHQPGSSEVQEKKGKANFVTQYDVTVQHYICSHLAEILPDIPCLGEEDSALPESGENKPSCFFLLDPIDGTTNFIHDYKRSSISLALIQDGQSVLGLVYNPYQEELFWAAKGAGAYCNESPIHVSQRCLSDGLVCFGTSPYYKEHTDKTFELAKQLFSASHGIRRSGSAALDLCDVACGRCDLFFECRLSPWDYAAGAILIQEAGGCITDLFENVLSYSKPSSVLAGTLPAYRDFFTRIRPHANPIGGSPVARNFLELSRRLEAGQGNVHRFMLYQYGETHRRDWHQVDEFFNCYSISKSFLATGIALAKQQRLLTWDQTIHELFPTVWPKNADSNLCQVTIQHLLDQTMGNAAGYLFEEDRTNLATDDWLAYCFSQPLSHPPGQTFVYSNSTYYILSCVLEQVTGQCADVYLQKQLFSRLGMRDYAWERCPRGHCMGATGLYLTLPDLIRFGRFYLENGIDSGTRLLPPEWISVLQQRVTETAYRNSFRIHPNGYFYAAGKYGQYLFVVPRQKLVLAIQATEKDQDISYPVHAFLADLE